MNCADWEERIALYAGGDLAGVEAERVQRHLAECPGFQVFWSGLKETLEELRETHQMEIPEVHFSAVRAGVMAELRREHRTWRRLAWISGVGIAAALVLGLALRPGPLPAPPGRVAARIPAAPLVATVDDAAPTERRALAAADRPRPGAGRQPTLVKLQTADPKIVIYWIAD